MHSYDNEKNISSLVLNHESGGNLKTKHNSRPSERVEKRVRD
jgi:hypothetical protein